MKEGQIPYFTPVQPENEPTRELHPTERIYCANTFFNARFYEERIYRGALGLIGLAFHVCAPHSATV